METIHLPAINAEASRLADDVSQPENLRASARVLARVTSHLIKKRRKATRDGLEVAIGAFVLAEIADNL